MFSYKSWKKSFENSSVEYDLSIIIFYRYGHWILTIIQQKNSCLSLMPRLPNLMSRLLQCVQIKIRSRYIRILYNASWIESISLWNEMKNIDFCSSSKCGISKIRQKNEEYIRRKPDLMLWKTKSSRNFNFKCTF